MGRWTFWGLELVVLFGLLGIQHQGWAEEQYTVKPGDTLYEISKSCGVMVEALKGINGLEGNTIRPKQILLIPTQRKKQTMETTQKAPDKTVKMATAENEKRPLGETESYVVQKGDSLFTISKRTGISVEEIKKMNRLQSTALKIGQILILPKLKIRMDEETEELGDAEEVAEVPRAEGEKDEEGASKSLGKWSSQEELSLFVRVVKTFLGVPYRLGGSTLKGIDCSAFVKKIYEIFNIHLPRTAREQLRMGKRVGKEELEEGDLVFFKTRRANNAHVGIYIGENKFVHASSRNKEVKVDHLDAPYFNSRFLRGIRVKEMEKES
jgi:peptidoglycan endopeptidase LytE